MSRIGERNYHEIYGWFEIVEYISSTNLKVKFDNTETIANGTYRTFTMCLIKDYNFPSIYGECCLGTDEKVDKKAYDIWYSMINRCYNPKWHEEHPTYEKCITSEEWKVYANFYGWYKNNYYEIDGQTMQLDKDILCKRNKIYSADTCCFVPRIINNAFEKSERSRGLYPIGVSFDKNRNKYAVAIRIENGQRVRGRFDSVEEAFLFYKKNKEEYLKRLAKSYKSLIPHELYEAMINYEVEVDD